MPSRGPLQGIVELTDHFRHWPAWLVLGLLLGTSALAGWIWGNTWVGVGLGSFLLADGLMLAALPRFGRSYGPPQLPLLSLAALRLLLTLGIAAALGRGGRGSFIFGLAQSGLWLVATYACWIEPARLGVTHITLRSPHLNGGPPLRLLHITDLHLERLTAREQQLLRLVAKLAPDLIVITGDYLNISFTQNALAQSQTRALLSQLQAPQGVYAIKGSPSVDPPQILAQLLGGGEITWLRDQVATLNWHGQRINVSGVECSYDVQADQHKLRRVLEGGVEGAFTLLLYHTPDLMPAAAEAGIDLYLAGHTHGGQLRLPLFGALVTASIYGKRYEMGLYREKETTLYVSRGIGMEGKGAPRARFLCPPEIVLFTLAGEIDSIPRLGAQRRG